MLKTLIFDLDGTLLNTIDDLSNAGNWVCTQNDWPTHTTDEYKQMVGHGIPNLVERFSPAEARTPEKLAGTLAQFSARYAAHKMDCTAPYEGIPAMLRDLRAQGIDVAVFSNKADGLCRAIITNYFGETFRVVRGSLPGVPTKPDPAGVLDMMQQLGADPATTAFVGDSDVDIFTAHNAKLPAIGVSWGFRGHDELTAAGAEFIIDSPAELVELAARI